MSTLRPRPLTPKPIYSWKSFSPAAELVYVRDAHRANSELEDLGDGPLGFDIEWKPIWTKNTRENPVSLVQLASQSKILLLQVSAMSEFPIKLQQILERTDIVKAGVGIQGDVSKLYHDHGVSTCNCVDLGLLARSADNARWKGRYTQPIGLARLVDTYIDLQLTKGKISRSNWEAMLSPTQQQYAANDAHSGLMLHNILSRLTESMEVPPKPVYYSFHAICGNLYDSSGAQWTASNPDYDPGPPPPPKVLKDPKEGEDQPRNRKKKATHTSGPRQGSGISESSRGSYPSSGSTGPQAPRFEPHPPRFPALPASNLVVATRLDSLAGPYSSQAPAGDNRPQVPNLPPAPGDSGNSLTHVTHLGYYCVAQEAAAAAPGDPFPNTTNLNNRSTPSAAAAMGPTRTNNAGKARYRLAPTGRDQRSWRSGLEAVSFTNLPTPHESNPKFTRAEAGAIPRHAQ